MLLTRIVLALAVAAFLALAAMSGPADAACACSKVGQSNGYYAAPSVYGSYGANYGPQQPLVQPVKPKAKSKKTPKSKPAAQ
jgi:hypothetical protein